MINFVLYEDKEIIRENYVKVIHKFMGRSDVSYKIYQFSAYNSDLSNYIKNKSDYNIYILDIEVPGKSGLDLAREIRATGDSESQLIVVTAHREMLENTFTNRSLILNFVSKFDNCEENLLSVLSDAYINITRYKSYVFKNDGELYRIPYNDILYFEAESQNGRINLVTKSKTYFVRKTMNNILKELHDPRFMRTHKSCIINLYNVEKVDLINSVIYFSNNIETLLLSRNYKKEFQERLLK